MSFKSLFSKVSVVALTASFSLIDIAPFNIVPFSTAQAQSANIVLEKLNIQAGIYKFIAAKIEVSGTSLTKKELIAILDGKSKEPAKQSLAKLNFAEAIIPELIIETKIADRADRQIYKNVKLSNVVAGKIARMSADGANFESKPASKKDKYGVGAFKGTYDAMNIEGLDLVAIAQVFNEKSNDENAPMQTIYSGYTLAGFRFDMSSPEAEIVMSAGKTSAGAFTARAGKYGFLEFVEMMKENPDVDDMDQEDKVKFFSSLLHIFSNFDLGPWQIDKLAISINNKDKKTPEKKNVDFKIASLKFGQPDSNFRMDGLDISVPDEKIIMKLASYDVKGYSLKPTLDAARAFVAAGKFESEDIAALDYREFMPVLGSSELNGLELQAPDKKGDFGGDIKMGVGQIKTSLSNQIRGIPTALSYKLSNLTIDVPALSVNEGVRFMRDNGIEKLDFSAAIEAKWLEETKQFAIQDISVTGEKLGSLKLSGAIGNMPKELFSGTMGGAQLLALALTAKAADVKIENKGFLELALKGASKDKNKTPEELKKEFVANIKDGLEKSIGDNEKSKAVIAGIEIFLNNGKSLTISVKPKADPQRSLDGIGAMDIFLAKEPKDVLDKLDVEVRAE